MHASASLSEDTCCWVYFTECKVHQLPSRLPKIFHCKLLSSREHGYKYKYTKVMLLDSPPPPPAPKQREPELPFFLGSIQRWGYLGMLRITRGGENRFMNCYWFWSENFFLSPLILWQEQVAADTMSICVLMRESTCSNPGAFHTQNGKNVSRGSFLGEKPLLDWDFFSQALQFHSRESCKCF